MENIKVNYKGFTEGETMTKESFIKAMRTNDAYELFAFNPNYYEEVKNEYWCDGKKDAVFVTAEHTWGSDAIYYRGLIVLEYGYMDIEAELFCKYDEEKETYTPVIDYFCCCKYGEGDTDWESDDPTSDYLTKEENKPNVDWNADDWEEQLKADMIQKLKLYCERKNYDYTKPVTSENS